MGYWVHEAKLSVIKLILRLIRKKGKKEREDERTRRNANRSRRYIGRRERRGRGTRN